MRAQFEAVCQYCGTVFLSRKIRRLYCSERCRRDFQDDRRMAERAEIREFEERLGWDETPHAWQDPWARCDEGGDDLDAWQGIWGNALLDAAPIIDDAPWETAAQPVGKADKLPQKRKQRKQHEGQLALPGMEQWLS